MYQFLFWLFSTTCFFHTAGVKSSMSQDFDAVGVYDYKTVDTIHTGSRYDSIIFFAPLKNNSQGMVTFGYKKNNNAIDTFKVYVNGSLKINEKLTTNTEVFHDILFTPSIPINPNKIIIKFRVTTGGIAGMKVFVRPLWVKQ